jgi:hypothetical protein
MNWDMSEFLCFFTVLTGSRLRLVNLTRKSVAQLYEWLQQKQAIIHQAVVHNLHEAPVALHAGMLKHAMGCVLNREHKTVSLPACCLFEVKFGPEVLLEPDVRICTGIRLTDSVLTDTSWQTQL